MQIDVVSDTVCPWCFIGKRRLEQALAQRPDMEFDVRWRPYQLDPGVPKEGMDRKEYYRLKFGDGERIKGASDAIRQIGGEVGIPFAFEKQERRPNTIDSHRLVRWANNVGLQDSVVEALFNAYFIEGRDVGEKAVLIDVAASCGMDAELTGDLLDSDADIDLVERESKLAGEMGIQGVPAYLIDNRFLLVGAQDPDVLLRAIDKAQSMRGEREPAAEQ
jgi:predicted DsbA family dithiol-disulfide isomerase